MEVDSQLVIINRRALKRTDQKDSPQARQRFEPDDVPYLGVLVSWRAGNLMWMCGFDRRMQYTVVPDSGVICSTLLQSHGLATSFILFPFVFPALCAQSEPQ